MSPYPLDYIRTDKDPSKQEITRSLPKAIQITQDIGFYALGCPNLSKLCVPCTFEFLILTTPYL
jgi:murein endopeptidase